jgi:hypothetical protein
MQRTSLNSIVTLAAVVLVLAYLIFRPHLGTIYTGYTFKRMPQETNQAINSGDLDALQRLELQPRREVKGTTPFASESDCQAFFHEYDVNRVVRVEIVCRPSYVFLWGW